MTVRRVLMRCDAGGDHGLGHLMRCLSLADALRAQGCPAADFVMQAPESIADRVRARGFTVHQTAATAGTDGEAMGRLLTATDGPVWLVIDGKYVEAPYVDRLSQDASVICFDDAPLRDFPARIIINSQPWTMAEDYPPRARRTVLAGAAYNAIDPAYFAAATLRNRAGVLITMGGEDPQNDTAWIARELGDLLADHPVEVVLGPAHPDPEAARQAVLTAWPLARVLDAPPSLVDCVSRAWLAISAGGTTCYELQAAGVVTAALAVEDHQRPFIAALERLGGVVALGGPVPRDAAAARAILHRLLTDAVWQQDCVQRGCRLFSGPGGQRLAAAIIRELDGNHDAS